MNELAGVALRVSVMYLFVLALLRLSGKRSIANLSPLDFAVATIIGDMFDDVFWAEIPVAQGLVGITAIIFVHTLLTLIQSRSQAVNRAVDGGKVQAVAHGKVVEKGLAKERTSIDELWSNLREQGKEQEKLGEIQAAYWEPSGQISVILEEAAEVVQKQDLPRLKELRR